MSRRWRTVWIMSTASACWRATCSAQMASVPDESMMSGEEMQHCVDLPGTSMILSFKLPLPVFLVPILSIVCHFAANEPAYSRMLRVICRHASRAFQSYVDTHLFTMQRGLRASKVAIYTRPSPAHLPTAAVCHIACSYASATLFRTRRSSRAASPC